LLRYFSQVMVISLPETKSCLKKGEKFCACLLEPQVENVNLGTFCFQVHANVLCDVAAAVLCGVLCVDASNVLLSCWASRCGRFYSRSRGHSTCSARFRCARMSSWVHVEGASEVESCLVGSCLAVFILNPFSTQTSKVDQSLSPFAHFATTGGLIVRRVSSSVW
jgi:hypothetical protein